jgi:hypothetical protein
MTLLEADRRIKRPQALGEDTWDGRSVPAGLCTHKTQRMASTGHLLRHTRFLCLSIPVIWGSITAHAQKWQWTPPTPDELSMTDQSGAPGAAAVVLYHEEVTDDNKGTYVFYNRIKILKQEATDAATIKLRSIAPASGYGADVVDFSGRTIHPDGTVFPITEPPQKETLQLPDRRVIEETYKLPQPEVGSILEYRYTIQLERHFEAPTWTLQRKYYVRRAHFEWHPLEVRIYEYEGSDARPRDAMYLGNNTAPGDIISYAMRLPPGVELKRVKSEDGISQQAFELDANDIPALPQEESMPPASSFAYSVRFFFMHDTATQEHWRDRYWKEAGERWSNEQNHFDEPGSSLKRAVAGLIAPPDTPEEKLRKLYAAVMKLDNLSVDRDTGKLEAKQALPVTAQSADDVLDAGRGTNDQINSVFVSMVRAAGLTANVMRVSNRDESIFNPDYLTLGQFDDDITVVELDGKEVYLDPGTRFCPFGHLGWRHAATDGIRQTKSGTEITQTPQEPVDAGQIQRVANLTTDAEGRAVGTIKLSYLGTSAIDWRQVGAVYGETEMQKRIKEQLEKTLPAQMEVEITSIGPMADFEEPLVMVAILKGPVGLVDGTQIRASADLFEARSTPRFQPTTRELPVYLRGREFVRDAIRINFPESVHVVSIPANLNLDLKEAGGYQLSAESTATSVTIRRNYAIGRIDYSVPDYKIVQAFFTKMSAKDQEPIVLQPSR